MDLIMQPVVVVLNWRKIAAGTPRAQIGKSAYGREALQDMVRLLGRRPARRLARSPR
jgi:hypothetical protein